MSNKKRVTVDWHGSEVARAVEEAILPPLKKCAVAVVREAKASMRRAGGREGEPSEPGQPPNVQSGVLRSNINYAPETVRDLFGRRTIVVVGPSRNAAYGRIHEHGENVGGRQYPERPFMAPALESAQRRFVQHFKNLRLAQTRAGRALNRKRRS